MNLFDRNLTLPLVSLLIGFVIGFSAFYMVGSIEDVSEESASNQLVEVMQNVTDQEYEVVNIDSEAGLYRVNLRTEDDTLETFHVTKNGEMFAPEMQNFEEIKQINQDREEFYSCLEENQVVIYGNLEEEETILQLQLLGGEDLENIYRDVRQEEVLEEARNRGVERIPAIYHDGNVLEGVNNLEEVEEFTGCTLE